MPPTKNPAAEAEVEDIKGSLSFLTEVVSAVRLQQKSILEVVKSLQLQDAKKDRRLDYLEIRLAEIEQNTEGSLQKGRFNKLSLSLHSEVTYPKLENSVFGSRKADMS